MAFYRINVRGKDGKGINRLLCETDSTNVEEVLKIEPLNHLRREEIMSVELVSSEKDRVLLAIVDSLSMGFLHLRKMSEVGQEIVDNGKGEISKEDVEKIHTIIDSIDGYSYQMTGFVQELDVHTPTRDETTG